MFGRSFRIFNESLAILRKDKEILLFPVLSGVFCILALVGMIYGGIWTGLFGHMFDDVISGSGKEAQIIGVLMVGLWYFLTWFIVIFFNVATVACAKIRLEGGDPVIGDGFRAGFANLGRIAAWALVSALVGLLLDAIENIRGVGKLLRFIIGSAWGVLTYFVIPVMIFEKRGPFRAIKSSKDLLRKTWGDALVGSSGLGLVLFLLALPALGLMYVGGSVGVFVGLAYLVMLVVVGSALGGIYRTALYVYATTGQVPAGFDEVALRSSFAPKASAWG
jgi:hypothetical protein